MKQFVFVDPYREVDSDAQYYRNDTDLIFTIFRDKKPVRVLMGLRRFGKTSFLRRLNRLCQPNGLFPDWTSRFLSASSARFHKDLERVRHWLSDELGKKEKGNYLLLIDDLMEIEKIIDKLKVQEQRTAYIERMDLEFGELWKQAVNSSGRIKIILAEPTCFDDWLNGERGVLGKGIAIFKRIFSNEENRLVLSALKADESFDLLRAVQKDNENEPALPGVTYELAIHLMLETGGNPWLLAHAQDVIVSNPDLLEVAGTSPLSVRKAADEIVKLVKRRTSGRDEALFDTIYMSLSSREKFILRFLAEGDETNHPENAHDQLQPRYAYTKSVWKEDASNTFTRMEILGLIETFPGTREPARIRSSFVHDRLKELYGKDLIINDPALRERWEEVLTTNPFRPPSAGIIHQFSDVLFSGLWEQDAWQTYMDELHRLKPENRPHLLIFCGNLLSAPIMDKGWIATAQKMCDCFKNLIKASDKDGKPLLQPAGRDRYFREVVLPEQIIVVPGIYDRLWSRQRNGTAPKIPGDSEIWVRMLAGVEGLNTPYYFPIPNLMILPLDTVSTDDLLKVASSAGYEFLPDQLTDLRSQLSKTVQSHIKKAESEQLCSKTLTRDALLYTMTGPDNLRDFGYVSPETVTELLSSARSAFLAGGGDRSEPLALAVTHHHPYQYYSTNDLAFKGYAQLRKMLVESGVSILLHGHSPLQTCLSETIRKWHVHKIPFHMVGAGSFRPTVALHEDSCSDTQDPPTFNAIRVERRDLEYDKWFYDVEIRFESIEKGMINDSSASRLKIKGMKMESPIE
ncbi:MAG: hypothetical protein LLG06_04515 [Desulfobacteraceae bacterium]|nr:hypothetical protein [Desulfobacteraceae bacterium]